MTKKRIVEESNSSGVAKRSNNSSTETSLDFDVDRMLNQMKDAVEKYKNQKVLIEKLLEENKRLKKENDELRASLNESGKVVDASEEVNDIDEDDKKPSAKEHEKDEYVLWFFQDIKVCIQNRKHFTHKSSVTIIS
jgi:regulator of replication initiation timing